MRSATHIVFWLAIVALTSTLTWADRTLEHAAVIDAPVSEVWEAWTTSEGFASWAAPIAQIDLRVGGEMRSNYNPNGGLDDDTTIVNRILAFEPQRMLAIQNVRAPKGFKGPEHFQQTWSVIYFTPLPDDRTYIRVVGLGYGEGSEWDELYRKFEIGNDFTLKKLQQKFKPDDTDLRAKNDILAERIDAANVVAEPGDSDDPQRVMELLKRLVGGEWIHETTRDDGKVFRVRNVLTHGPDGASIIANGWLGDARGMIYHASGQIWLEPGAGGVVLHQTIDESGSVARGRIRCTGEHQLTWDWNLTTREGQTIAHRVQMTFEDDDHYRFVLEQQNADGNWAQMRNLRYERVAESPPQFKTPRAHAAPSE